MTTFGYTLTKTTTDKPHSYFHIYFQVFAKEAWSNQWDEIGEITWQGDNTNDYYYGFTPKNAISLNHDKYQAWLKFSQKFMKNEMYGSTPEEWLTWVGTTRMKRLVRDTRISQYVTEVEYNVTKDLTAFDIRINGTYIDIVLATSEHDAEQKALVHFAERNETRWLKQWEGINITPTIVRYDTVVLTFEQWLTCN